MFTKKAFWKSILVVLVGLGVMVTFTYVWRQLLLGLSVFGPLPSLLEGHLLAFAIEWIIGETLVALMVAFSIRSAEPDERFAFRSVLVFGFAIALYVAVVDLAMGPLWFK